VCVCLCIGEGCLKKKRPTLTHAAAAAWSSAAERSSYPNPTINILATRTTSGGIILIKKNICVCNIKKCDLKIIIFLLLLF